MRIGSISVNTKYSVDPSTYNQIPNSGTVNKTQTEASVTPDPESGNNNTNNTPSKKGWSLVAIGFGIATTAFVIIALTPSKKPKKRKK